METQASPEVQVALTEDTFSLMKTPTPNPWGIVSGQYREPAMAREEDWRCKRFIAGAGWYNKRGEYVGSGDLSFCDISKLSHEILQGDEIFVALSDKDSFRNFIRGTKEYDEVFYKGNGLYAAVPPWQKPGPDYLADRCVLLIAHHQICLAEDKANSDEVWMSVVNFDRENFTMMDRDELRDIIKKMAKFQE